MAFLWILTLAASTAAIVFYLRWSRNAQLVQELRKTITELRNDCKRWHRHILDSSHRRDEPDFTIIDERFLTVPTQQYVGSSRRRIHSIAEAYDVQVSRTEGYGFQVQRTHPQADEPLAHLVRRRAFGRRPSSLKSEPLLSNSSMSRSGIRDEGIRTAMEEIRERWKTVTPSMGASSAIEYAVREWEETGSTISS